MPHEVQISKERLNAIHQGLIAMLNQLRNLGFSQDEILSGLLFTCGMAMRQRGWSVDLAGAIGAQLPPLVLGYEMARPETKETEAQKLLRAKGYTC